jgi:broad specificity phosphatase PhoE
MTLIIRTIRHGLTQSNRDRRCSAPADELSDAGRQQARDAANAIRMINLGRIICSPFPRAIETAQLVTGLSRDAFLIDDLCRERDFGGLAGLSHDQVVSSLPGVEYIDVAGIPYSVNPPGGETLEELQARGGLFYRKLLCEHKTGAVVIFSHGNFLQQFRGTVLGMDYRQSLDLPLEGILNLAMMSFEFDGGRLVSHHVQQLARNDAGVRGLY